MGVLIVIFGDILGLWDISVVFEGVEVCWGNIQGNLFVYLMWMVIVWISVVFGEEMFFCVVLIMWVECVFCGFFFVLGLVVLMVVLIFGIGYFYYQGMWGLIVIGMIGVVLGLFYFVYKCNFWLFILVYGLVDSFVMIVFYQDVDWQL